MKRITFLLLLVSNPAWATYTCTGPVQGVAINPKNGMLLAQHAAGFNWPAFCSVEVEENGVSPETCKHIYSMLLSAQVSKKDITLWFNDDADGGNCSSKTQWAYLNAWYFGPKINQ